MSDQEFGGGLRPLCRIHHKVMNISPDVERGIVLPTSGHCECPERGCSQNYSPSFGYFTLSRRDDHWKVTGSGSLQILRGHTQVICGAHKDLMFLESFDPETNLESYHCPRKDCRHTFEIPAGGPPTYWLAKGYFARR